MKKQILTTSLLLATLPVFAANWSAQVGALPKLNDHAEPIDLRGLRAAARYLPNREYPHHLHIYWEGSVANFHSSIWGTHESLTILGLSPVVRMNFGNMLALSPYFEFGIGGSWLSKSVFVTRRLGGHWQFQDMAGVGAEFGEKNPYYLGLQILHYSNAGLADDNRGITAPLLLTLGTRNFS